MEEFCLPAINVYLWLKNAHKTLVISPFCPNKTFMWRFFTSSEILEKFWKCSSFTRHLECLRLPTKRVRYFPIFGVVNLWRTSVSSIHNHRGLSFLHVVHTNWQLRFKFLFFDMFKEDNCDVRKVTAALQVVRFFNRFSLQDGILLQCKKSDCHPASGKVFQ